MSNFELPSHTPTFDLLWQQWLARMATSLTTDSTHEVSNKTFDLSENTLTGTTAEFNAALSDSNFLTDASIGSTVQAWDANLDQIAALSPTNNNFIVGNGTSWALETPSDARTSLGLGTMATQDANNVNIDGGTIDGVTIGGDDPVTLVCDDITIQDTSANIPQLLMSATDGAANLKSWRWRVTGSGLQLDAINDAFNTTRTALAFTKNSSQTITSISMGSAGNTLLTLNASTLDINADAIDIDGGSAASASITGDISSITLTVSGSFTVNGSNVLTASVVGSTVQAWDANLDQIAALTPTDGNFMVGDGSAWVAESGATARTSLGLGTGDTAQFTALTLVSTDAGAAAAPVIRLERDSASPAANDVIGAIAFLGEDSLSNQDTYVSIRADILDPTSASEDGALVVRSIQAGALRTILQAATGLQVFNSGTAPTSGDMGAGTINASALYDDGSLVLHEASSPTVTGTWTWTTTAAGTAPITVESTEAGSGGGPFFDLYRNSASPAASDSLGTVRFVGEDSDGNKNSYAQILAIILDPTSASEDADLRVQTQVAGTLATRIIIGQGVQIGSPTGGDQGSGTLNATAVYDDGVLLTDYVFDAEADGDYSVVDYDSRVPQPMGNGSPPRQHGPARRFKTNFDELNPVAFANKWRASRKLPAMARLETVNSARGKSSSGEVIQALIETCEVLAVHLDKHETRLQALET